VSRTSSGKHQQPALHRVTLSCSSVMMLSSRAAEVVRGAAMAWSHEHPSKWADAHRPTASSCTCVGLLQAGGGPLKEASG